MKKITILSLCLATVLSGAIAIGSYNAKDTKNEVSSAVEKDIYATISLSSADERVDIDNTEELYDFSDVVVVGTVVSKEDATMSEKSALPYTPGCFKVENVIKGDISTGVIDIAMAGGTCTVEDFINASKNFPERIQKMGLNGLSEKEKKTKYIEYIFPHHKDFEVGKEYVLMLSKSDNDSTYYVLSDAGFLDLNIATNSKMNVKAINSKKDILSMPNAKIK